MKTRIRKSGTGHLIIESNDNNFVVSAFSAPVAETVTKLYAVAEQVQEIATVLLDNPELHYALGKLNPELLHAISEADRKARNIFFGID